MKKTLTTVCVVETESTGLVGHRHELMGCLAEKTKDCCSEKQKYGFENSAVLSDTFESTDTHTRDILNIKAT